MAAQLPKHPSPAISLRPYPAATARALHTASLSVAILRNNCILPTRFPKTPMIRNLLSASGSCLLTLSAMASGPGLPNLSHPTRFEVLSEFRSANKSPFGQGFVTMHDGYLFVPFSQDGGGGGGNSGFTFYDISNPRAPVVAFSTLDSTDYSTEAGGNFAGDLREPHGYTIAGDIACFTMNDKPGNKSGLQFWDFSDIDGAGPVRLSEISLGSLTGGDYDNTAWWVAWQGGRYAYVAGTNAGLYIVDATDPSNPVVKKQVPTGQLGGFRINTVHVIGNLMVVTNGNNANGIATFDIGDPLNPQALDVETGFNGGYSVQMNADRILVASDPARVYSIADPSAITLVGTGPDVAGGGGYGIFKDGHFIYGSSSAMVDLDLTTSPISSNGTLAPTGFTNPDWDFATPLGNMIFMGNDHNGSALVTNSTTPDTSPPAVTMVSPRNGTTGQPLTSRIGIGFSDLVEGAQYRSGFGHRPSHRRQSDQRHFQQPARHREFLALPGSTSRHDLRDLHPHRRHPRFRGKCDFHRFQLHLHHQRNGGRFQRQPDFKRPGYSGGGGHLHRRGDYPESGIQLQFWRRLGGHRIFAITDGKPYLHFRRKPHRRAHRPFRRPATDGFGNAYHPPTHRPRQRRKLLHPSLRCGERTRLERQSGQRDRLRHRLLLLRKGP